MRRYRESSNVIDIRESNTYSVNQQNVDVLMPTVIATLLITSGIILMVAGLVNSSLFSGIKNRINYK